GKDAQHVEHTAVCGASAAAPSAGRGIGAGLGVSYVSGDGIGARVEGGVVTDLAIAAGHVFDGLVPLSAQYARSVDLAAGFTLVAVSVGAYVFQAGAGGHEGCHVGMPPPCGGRTDQDAPEDR